MARGEHPGRTPVYGGLLVVAATVGATVVWTTTPPGWLRASLMVLALVAAPSGWLMTFRNPTPPRRRR